MDYIKGSGPGEYSIIGLDVKIIFGTPRCPTNVLLNSEKAIKTSISEIFKTRIIFHLNLSKIRFFPKCNELIIQDV